MDEMHIHYVAYPIHIILLFSFESKISSLSCDNQQSSGPVSPILAVNYSSKFSADRDRFTGTRAPRKKADRAQLFELVLSS